MTPISFNPRLLLRGVFMLLGLGVILWPWLGRQQPTESTSFQSRPVSLEPAEPSTATLPIGNIEVGQRVLAHNPEISDAERENWSEPDWSDCFKLTLAMPLGVANADGDPAVLDIQMIRPESWVRDRLEYLVEEKPTQIRPVAYRAKELDGVEAAEPSSLPPLRPLYLDLLSAWGEADSRSR